MRIAMAVEYDGSEFCGWQSQTHAANVQDTVEAALARVADHPLRVVCAGRTDTGVHATQQVIHFDTTSVRTARAWVLGGNANLPRSVNLLWAREVTDDFHARFSATARHYRYVILNRFTRSALHRDRVCWVHDPLDAARMQAAARHLVGEHDFTSFRALACQAKHARRELHQLRVERHGEYISIDVCANAFLHHMVRNIAGTLLAVGKGEQAPDWVAELLRRQDRAAAGVTAPAQGLYLVGVEYPADFDLPLSVCPPAWF